MVAASYDELMRQAPMTVDLYLGDAIERIDRRLGSGYAQKHPELIAAFIRASASDFSTAVICKTIEEGVGQLQTEISEIGR